ncbi:MAG: DNA/RNA nuclease SfsA [Gammaproteobacteria bacterium TMED1]|nr:MAG: DNA/RNA nuclease SfsA [Gammaproteobacteria bacterium TMED1]
MKGYIKARLIRRHKRFLADVYLQNGTRITVHCPNTGSMRNCLEHGASVWLSHSSNPGRKYQYTLEFLQTKRGHYIGLNSGRANKLVSDAIRSGVIKELRGYSYLKPEVKYGVENSRIDFVLSEKGRRDCYVEVKSVTLLESPFTRGEGYFPDSVSIRGQKHLRELSTIALGGARALLLFCVQHSGIRRVRSADHIDSAYGESLRTAIEAGVEVVAYKTRFGSSHPRIWRPIPFEQ